MILAERERGLTVVSLEGDALSGFEHATLDLVQGDAVGGGQVTLGDGDLGAQREGTQMAVALARLDSRLVGLVDRQIGIVLQRDGQGVLEVLRVVGELAIDLLRHREALAREGIRGRTETHRHRDGRKLLAGHIELHGAGELTDDASGTLGTLNASRNLDDRRLVRGDLREGHGQLLGRALDRRSSAEGIIRGVLAQALTLGRGRIDDDEGVLLDVVDHRVAVELQLEPAGASSTIDAPVTAESPAGRITRYMMDLFSSPSSLSLRPIQPSLTVRASPVWRTTMLTLHESTLLPTCTSNCSLAGPVY